MAKKPLKSQLNQIRAWAREGRTDAWIAHQLDVSAAELQGFRKRHGLSADDEPLGEDDLRDTIEAEIEAATLAEAEAADDDEEDDEDTGELEFEHGPADDERESSGDDESGEVDRGDSDQHASDESGQRRGRRRRGRRGGSRRPGVGMEASFDHGGKEGYGLWLDPVVADDPVYDEHWRGHSEVTVTVEPDRIVITRSN